LVFIAVAAAVIAGCGIREPLRPADGASLPPLRRSLRAR
jgi:hypothetical protein